MSRSRRAAVAAAFATAAAVAGPGSALPAQAATCYGTACNNVDPHAAGCDQDTNIKNLDDRQHNNVRFVLRYSPACDAAWVRYSFVNGRGTGPDVISIEKLVKPPYRDAYWVTASTTRADVSTVGWTKMVGGTATIRGKLNPAVGTASPAYTNSASI